VYNIKLLNKISADGLSALSADKYEIGEGVENPDAIIVRSAAMHDMTFGPELLAIARAGAGTNNIPTPKCSEQGICVFNTPGANANAVKELTVMALIMSARNAFPAMQWAQELKGKGDEVPALVEKGKNNYVGPELKGRTLGVVGLGLIGYTVANTAIALGMKVVGYDPYLTPEAAAKLDKAVVRLADLKEVYAASDFLSLHLPSIPETRGMFNTETLGQMKKGTRILNFARGDLVNSADMIAALAAGQVGKYVTDFPDDSLLGNPGVLALPHLGASTPESEENCAIMAAAQTKEYLEDGNVINSINLPRLSVPRNGSRVCVIHKNAEGAADKIAAAAGGKPAGAVRGELGYMVIDGADDVAGKLAALPEVIKARYLK